MWMYHYLRPTEYPIHPPYNNQYTHPTNNQYTRPTNNQNTHPTNDQNENQIVWVNVNIWMVL